MTTWRGWCRCWTRRARCRAAATNPPGCAARAVAATRSSLRRRAHVYRHALECALLPRLMWRLEDAVARQPEPAGLPLRGDPRLSDARQCRAARRLAGARMDEAGLAGGVSRSRLCAAARRAAAASGCAAGRAAAAGAARRRTGRRGAQHVSPRCRWRSGSIRASARPRRRSACRRGGRAMRWVRRAWRCSCGRPASRWTMAFPASSPSTGFHKVLLPSLAGAAKSVVSESWVLGERVRARSERPADAARWSVTSSALYEADYAPAWERCWRT